MVDRVVAGPLRDWQVSGGDSPAVVEARALLEALGAQRVAAAESGLVLVAPDGCREQVEGYGTSAAADWGASGVVWLTGRSSGPPLLPGGRVASRAGGALLAVRLLSRLVGAEVDVDGRRLLAERAAIAGFGRHGPSTPGGGTRMLAARDGHLAMTLARDDDIAALPALLEQEQVGEPWSAVTAWAAEHTTREISDRAALLGIPAAGLGSAGDPETAPYRLRMSALSRPERSRAPLVVDLTSLWAGPLAANLLGLAGCRIVKVEASARLDGSRRGPAAFYDLMHAGHAAVRVDLWNPSGLATLRRLLDAADLVLESARPRAFRQLGIGPDDTPGSWLAIRAYDAAGPFADRAGFGDDVAVGAGLAVFEDGRALPVGDAIADPVAGACSAVAALATLVGTGTWHVETSLAQALAAVAAAAPGVPARQTAAGWVVDADGEQIAVALPHARVVPGVAAAPGADDGRLEDLLAC